jgi:transcription elongation factor GreA
MSYNKNYETKQGEKLLHEKLSKLKEQAVKIIDEIAYAKSFGDLSENAEYKEAKEVQKKLSQQLSELTEYKNNLCVVDPENCNVDQISIGATVYLLNLDTDEKKVYKIVGMCESDASNGLIYYQSPLAKALFGKKVGDEIEFKPSKDHDFYYEVIDIKYH